MTETELIMMLQDRLQHLVFQYAELGGKIGEIEKELDEMLREQVIDGEADDDQADDDQKFWEITNVITGGKHQ